MAYAARSLASFIGLVGHLDSNEIATRAFHDWYQHVGQKDPESLAKVNRAKADVEAHTMPLDILFLGVFDTVRGMTTDLLKQYQEIHAVEILREFLERKLQSQDGYHDTRLARHIKNAYHAVAIDEDHVTFEPILLNVSDGTNTKEMWFAGGHGDVGGGHKGAEDDRALAKVPLAWMMKHAVDAGLVLKPNERDRLRADANALAPQHVQPPHIHRLVSGTMRRRLRRISADALIHDQVRERIDHVVERRDSDGKHVDRVRYKPTNLPA